MKKFLKFLSVSLAVLACLFLSGLVYYAVVTKDAHLDEKKLVISNDKIELFDYCGEKIQPLSSTVTREGFCLAELPEGLEYAFVDTEDRNFFAHGGFDYKRIAKAAWNNLRARSFKEGASTISQQLIKNTHLTQEKTIKRKLKEFKLTRALEKKYSKEEILEKYLDTIYFGHNCFGLPAAARFYFGKSYEELTLSDAAVLAGLVKSPNNYSPFKQPENCLKRKKIVLSAMKKAEHIDEAAYTAALNAPLPEKPDSSALDKSYFTLVFDELEELSERYDFPLGGTIRIYTYLDQSLQATLSSLAAESETDKIYSVLDLESGGLKGYYSSVGNIKRLPASLIKPLLVYAPALEEETISPATPILDEKTDFGGYTPKNFDGKFGGYMSARECLSKSVNVPAVKILNSVGIAKSAAYLNKLGLDIPEDDYSLALALGGMKEGFTLNELLSAYAAFPRGGEFSPAAAIQEIEIDSRSAYKRKTTNISVFSKDTAYLVTDMLQTAAKTGTAKKLRSLPFSIAAKTGTGGDEKGNRDAYSLTYTTRDIVGVWLGNADNSPTNITGGGLPTNIALKINESLYREKIPAPFIKPDGVEEVMLDKSEYYDTHNMILADPNSPITERFSELFRHNTMPVIQSEKYSKPSIPSPSIEYKDKKAVIRFKAGAPKEYEYIIDKFDLFEHETLYRGEFKEEIIDDNLKENGTYIYTVTPVYKDFKGTEIVLPAVTTKGEGDGTLTPIEPTPPPDIVGKDWWNY